MLFMLALATALATGIKFDEVPCPFGEGTVRRYNRISANTYGGYDSDLAAYSTRGQFRTHAVSTCTSNYFSAMSSALDRPIPADKNTQVQAAIDDSRKTWTDRDNPAVWERYDTAARIAHVLGTDPLEIAEMYLNASWTVRDAAVGVYVGGLEGPSAARTILKLGAVELDKDLTAESRSVLLYNLARVAHRGGFNTERDLFVQQFLALPALKQEERDAGEKLKQLTERFEPHYQDLAISFLKAGIATPGDPTRIARARYQLADLARRRGQTEMARKGYKSVIKDTAAPQQLQAMAQFLLGEIDD